MGSTKVMTYELVNMLLKFVIVIFATSLERDNHVVAL